MPDLPSTNPASHESDDSSFAVLERLFLQVAEVPREHQDAKLAELCAYAGLRQQVRELLDADSCEDELLDHSLFPEPAKLQTGERIDGYQLLQELAEGGMGVVFLAEQFEPVRRQVALKVIKPGVDTREVIARFDAERQALSLMSHPNIATVLDAGTTDQGRPYFVMELVKGQPITAYCDNNQLSVQQRLELFLPVCHAIQHAHQKGIIHRDIKPSNVLVAEYDGRPVAKVIDFGIAKAINQPLTELTVATGIGQIIGTFEYMSPEQSQVNQLDVDTRSDIYSLGVLLYELLTGSPPFDKTRLRSVAWDEMLRIIREEDPPRPSSRLARTVERPSGENPVSSKPVKLGRLVKNELDWIVMKAMEKDRDRRYESPNELANDIGCFLTGDAVAACPPSTTYRFRKFARRNKAILATSAIVTASLVFGIIGTSWQAVRALNAEKTAEVNAAKADASTAEAVAVTAFLKNDLLGLAGAESQLSAGLQPDPELKLETLLDRAVTKLNQGIHVEPNVEIILKATVADSFNSIGRYDAAAPLYEDFKDYLIIQKGESHLDTLRVKRKLVTVYLKQSNLQYAAPLCHDALKLSEEHLGANHDVTLQLMNDQAILYREQKEYPKALQQHLKCLNIKRLNVTEDHPDILSIKSDLALVYERQNFFKEAISVHEQVLAVRRDASDQLAIAASLNNIGRCQLKRGRHSEDTEHFLSAVPCLQEGMRIFERHRGLKHPDTLGTKNNLAQIYCELRDYDQAEPMLNDLVKQLKSRQGHHHGNALQAMNILGWTRIQQNRLAEAEHILKEAAERHRSSDHQNALTIQTLGNLAIVYYRMGKLDASVSTDEETLPLAQTVLGKDHVETISCMTRLGLSYLETGPSDDERDLTIEGRELLADAFDIGQHLPGAFQIAGSLADSYSENGDAEDRDLDQVLLWNTRLVENAKQQLPAKSSQLAKAIIACGSRLFKMKAWAEAEDVLRSCDPVLQSRSAESWLKSKHQAMLGQALFEQQKYTAATPLLKAVFNWSPKITTSSGTPSAGFTRRQLKTADQLILIYDELEDTQQAAKWRATKSAVLANTTQP